MSKPLDLVVPIKVSENKTIWHKIGVVFKNEKEDKKHLISVSIQSIPLKAFSGGEITAYVFLPKDTQLNYSEQEAPPIGDHGPDYDDVPF